MKIKIYAALIAILVAVGLAQILKSDPVKLVKSGEKILQCEFKDGLRTVNPDLVLYEQDGYWKFTNGSANSCFLSDNT